MELSGKSQTSATVEILLRWLYNLSLWVNHFGVLTAGISSIFIKASFEVTKPPVVEGLISQAAVRQTKPMFD